VSKGEGGVRQMTLLGIPVHDIAVAFTMMDTDDSGFLDQGEIAFGALQTGWEQFDHAHAEMTTPPKMDTKCTTPSLIPPVNGNTVRSFPTHGQLSAAQGSSIRSPGKLNHCLTL
jgi:hypothetical protein